MTDGTFIEARGVIQGEITREPRGAGGFGYDALFIPKNETRTFAEMTEAEKNEMSHRFMAAASLIKEVCARWDLNPHEPRLTGS